MALREDGGLQPDFTLIAHLFDLVQVTVDVVSRVRRIQTPSVLLHLFSYEVFYVLVDALHSLVWPRQTAHQTRERVVKLWRMDEVMRLHLTLRGWMSFVNEPKKAYLCTNRGFDLETPAKRVHQFFKVLVAVLKTMAKNQGADDVGDDVVEHELWSKGLSYARKSNM